MKKTENFNLNLPELNDNYNVEDSNNNMSIIDAELKIQSEEIDEAQAELEEVQEEMDGVQRQVASMRTEISSAQTGIANAQAKADSTQAEVEKLKTDIKTLSDSRSVDGVNIDFSFGKTFQNSDTEIVLAGYIRGKEAHLSVTGWLGSETAKNNTHLHVLVDDEEYKKLFEQFNVRVSVPYIASYGGYRQAMVCATFGEAVSEYTFTHKTTGEKVKTFSIYDYIDNSNYDWTDTVRHTGIDLWWQGFPDVTMATYPLCINGASSCIWEGV